MGHWSRESALDGTTARTAGRWRYARRIGIALGAAILVAPLVAGTAAAADVGTVKVCVTDSTGNNLTLGAAYANNQAWYRVPLVGVGYLGQADADGCREQSVPADTDVTVWASVNGTYSNQRTVQAGAGATTTVTFYTTDVTIQYPGNVTFGGATGGRAWFKNYYPSAGNTASMELLSNGANPYTSTEPTPVMFQMNTAAGKVSTPVSWPAATGTGAAASFTLMAMQVLDNAGTGLPGATARFTWPYESAVPGSTDARGLLGWSVGRLLNGTTVTAKVHGTTASQSGNPATTPLFTFQTTNLTLHYKGNITYHATYWYHFDGPSMEFFPGTYAFQFASGPAAGNPGGADTQTDITIPDASAGPVEKTAVVARLQDSTGAGLVGQLSYYLAGWHSGPTTTMSTPWDPAVPSTTSPGSAVVLLDGAPTNVVFAMTYNGTRQQLARQNVQDSSVAYFHTSLVRVAIQGHDNDYLDIPADGSASYFAGGWHAITTLDPNDNRLVQTQMLPGSYSFAATYHGTRDQKNGVTVGPDAVTGVYFHAALVKVELDSHVGDVLNIPASGSASYFAGGWHAITTPDASDGSIVEAEMLPGSYSFAVTYNGTRQQKTQTIIEPNPNNHDNAVQTVVFQTSLVTVMVQAQHDVLDIPNDGSASYFAGGWHAITTPDADNQKMVQAEMLPGSYSFAATYQGTRDQKNRVTVGGTATTVSFHAALVQVSLHDVTGDVDLAANGSASYYAGGWHAITTPDGTSLETEMLPGNYSFAVTNAGTRLQTRTRIVEPNPNDGTNWTQQVQF